MIGAKSEFNNVPHRNWVEDTKVRFPHLFRGIHPFNFDCGEGWKVIVITLCERLDAMGLPNLKINQIKEKFGSLRFYADGGNEAVSVLIHQAEIESSITCEWCGVSGKKISDGRLLTLCEPCQAKRKDEQSCC